MIIFMKIFEFEAEILRSKDMNATFLEFPFDIFESFGSKGQVRVYAQLNNYTFRGNLAKMGHNCHFLGIKKEHRDNSGLNAGDVVIVKIWQDLDERIIEIPDDFEAALDEFPQLKEFFNKMSFSHRKEFSEYITSAKKQETRIRRIDKSILMLMKEFEKKQMGSLKRNVPDNS